MPMPTQLRTMPQLASRSPADPVGPGHAEQAEAKQDEASHREEWAMIQFGRGERLGALDPGLGRERPSAG